MFQGEPGPPGEPGQRGPRGDGGRDVGLIFSAYKGWDILSIQSQKKSLNNSKWQHQCNLCELSIK